MKKRRSRERKRKEREERRRRKQQRKKQRLSRRRKLQRNKKKLCKCTLSLNVEYLVLGSEVQNMQITSAVQFFTETGVTLLALLSLSEQLLIYENFMVGWLLNVISGTDLVLFMFRLF